MLIDTYLQGFGETFPTNPRVVPDMTSLHHIHEAGILHNLRERSKLRNQRPYTFMVREKREMKRACMWFSCFAATTVVAPKLRAVLVSQQVWRLP